MDISKLLKQLDLSGAAEVVPFLNAAGGAAYAVWKVTAADGVYVLKKAKEYELSVYAAFFREQIPGVPRFLKRAIHDGAEYFLMEYVAGQDLRRCDRQGLKAALHALMALQDRYWACAALSEAGFTFEMSMADRKSRRRYLNDPELERAYTAYLQCYETLPRCLCHDDLLPVNVLVCGDSATIIDWEYAGLLPYPTSLARLIAHGTEEEDAVFYMTEADKAFAIDYYYEQLVRHKGIAYADYRRALDLFLLYEYSEWIVLGNRYPDTDRIRYEQYYRKAKAHIAQMKN